MSVVPFLSVSKRVLAFGAVLVLGAMSAMCSGGGKTEQSGGGQAGTATVSGGGGGIANSSGGSGGTNLATGGSGQGGTAGGQGGSGGMPSAMCTGALPKLKLTRIAEAGKAVTYVAQPTKTSPLFVLRREGVVSIVKNGNVQSPPFLNIAAQSVQEDGERGLLGLAFHPAYETNGRFFVYYTKRGSDPVTAGPQGNIVIAEGKRSAANPEVADAALKSLLTVDHSQHGNHNGGMLAFGRDGLLYAGVGDGGSSNDPFKAAQKPDSPLGKILRIDVDNPSARPAGNMPEPANKHVWAIGLRNPWRLSFDRLNGDLYIGDVGQGEWEEVDVVPAPQLKAGINFGWSIMEGRHCFQSNNCTMTNLIQPVAEYENPPNVNGNDPGRSIIGGFAYRGTKMPCLAGRYFYGDHNANQVWSFVYAGGNATAPLEHTADLATADTRIQGLSTFGEDADGELYIADVFGNVYRIDPE